MAEVKQLVEAVEADLVIFDNPLSPSQQRNLAEELTVLSLEYPAYSLNFLVFFRFLHVFCDVKADKLLIVFLN